MKRIFNVLKTQSCLILLTSALLISCDKDELSKRDLLDKADDVRFIIECINDWDCSQGVLFHNNTLGDSKYVTYHCEDFAGKTAEEIFSDMGNFTHGSYDPKTKSMSLSFMHNMNFRDVSFYTKSKH